MIDLMLRAQLTFVRRLPAAALAGLCFSFLPLHAARVVVIGDSLSAEYEAIPDFPGTDNPTEYARVTVKGWEALSWVEVLGRVRREAFDFGSYKSDLLGWRDLRFSGYELNFAIPGFRAAQYADIVTSSLFANPQYLPFRAALEDALESSERAVIWLGANEFRANYGFLARGGDPTALINELISDLKEVLDFVRRQRSNLQIVVANLPDLGAAPDKRAAYPEPSQRAAATDATKRANAAIASLALSKGAAVADMFSQTERLLSGVTTFFGAVEIFNASHPDNHPRFHFTREGLHPNTPSQIEAARSIIDAFNRAFSAAIPQISDREALNLLGVRPDQPYFDWISNFATSETAMDADPDRDGLPNLVELAFGLNPTQASRLPVTVRMSGEGLVIAFVTNREFRAASRLVKIVPQGSSDLVNWTDLPASLVSVGPDGSSVAHLPRGPHLGFVRLQVALAQPN